MIRGKSIFSFKKKKKMIRGGGEDQIRSEKTVIKKP